MNLPARLGCVARIVPVFCAAAHDDRAMKETLRGRHAGQNADFSAAARLAEDRYVTGVSAERRDVLPHPVERLDDVEHPDVARLRVLFAADLRQVQVAEDVQAGA